MAIPHSLHAYRHEVPSVFFRKQDKPTPMDPAELVRRLTEELTAAFQKAAIEVVDGSHAPALRWCDGPAPSAVASVVGTIVNWQVVAVDATQAPSRGPVVLLDRYYSAAALAVAVVRFRGSHVRPYSSADPGAVEGLAELLDIDDPGRSGYPVVDTMAALLVDAPEPPEVEHLAGADRLSAKLSALGYDSLWSVAWSSVR